LGGADANTDIAYLLLTLPDFLVSLILAGGLNTTLIPKLLLLTPKERKQFAGQTFLFIGILFSSISIIIIIFSDKFLYLLAPGISINNISLGREALIIISFILPISALNGVLNAVLNSKNIFTPGALASSLINFSIVLILLLGNFLFEINLIWSLVMGYIIGVFIRFLIQLFLAFKELNFNNQKHQDFLNYDLLKTFISNFGFSSAILLIPVISRAFSSQINEGSLSLFTYSNKLVELPMALIIGSATTVLLPHISKNKNFLEINKIIKKLFYIALFLSVISFLIAPLIIEIVFSQSNFNSYQFKILKEITSYGFLFLIPMSLTSLYGTIFAALRNLKPLVISGLIMIFTLIFLNIILIHLKDLRTIIFSFGMSYFMGALYLNFSYGRIYIKNKLNKF